VEFLVVVFVADDVFGDPDCLRLGGRWHSLPEGHRVVAGRDLVFVFATPLACSFSPVDLMSIPDFVESLRSFFLEFDALVSR